MSRSLRVKVGDRVWRLTTDGNRYSRETAVIQEIVRRADNPKRALVQFKEGDYVRWRSGAWHADGTATCTQLKRAEDDAAPVPPSPLPSRSTSEQ